MPQHNPVTYLHIDSEEVVSLSANTTGEFSVIADISIPEGWRYEFPRNEPIEFFAYTHESFTVTASSTETKSLSNNLVNSPALRDIDTGASETAITGPRSLVVWDDEDDIQTGVDSVDYDANEFTYTDSDAGDNPLEVFYLWGDSSQVEFRHYNPAEDEYEKRFQTTMRRFHESRVFDSDSYITFDNQFTAREKDHLKVTLKTDVDLTNWDVYDENQGGGPGTMTTYSYSDFAIPVRKIPTA